MGLDLSLTGSAAVILFADWTPSKPWKNLARERYDEEGKLPGVMRAEAVAGAILKFASVYGVAKAAVEQYAFSFRSDTLTETAELVGAVRLKLYEEIDLELFPVVASSARKTLLGPMPKMSRKEWKAHLKHVFDGWGAPFDDEDTRDAFVVVNRLRHDLGLSCLASE